MATTRVFKSGNSQAVRLPKEFQFDVEEIEILRRGDEIVLRKRHESMAALFDALAALADDGAPLMPEGREQGEVEERGE